MKRIRAGLLMAASAMALVACSGGQHSSAAGPGAAAPPVVDGKDWASYDLLPGGGRFSPLTQIKKENLDRLSLGWTFDIDETRPVQSTPIVVNGVMYLTAAWGKVYALNAATGKELWRYDPKVPAAWEGYDCCVTRNRGVAVSNGKVFVGAFDGRLIALEAATGKPLWSTQTFLPGWPYVLTSAPRVFKGKVLIGNAGADMGVRGYVSAYDPDSGKLLWRFYTVPGNPADGFENKTMEMAAKTWTGEWWKMGGGGTVWESMVYDPQLDLLYVGVGNGGPWNQKIRSPGGGDNLFLASIVALRPDTGEYVWHYQTVPGDTWDYTAVQPMILADLEIEGRTRKVLMQAPKNGFFYVIDRETGKLISAAKHQPTNWATQIDLKTGRPMIVPAAHWDITGKVTSVQPASTGSAGILPAAFSPHTKLMYFPSHATSQNFGPDPAYKFVRGFVNLGSCMGCLKDEDVEVRLPTSPQTTTLVAWDPVRQQEVWRANNPVGREGGVLATASDLIFNSTGRDRFVARDAWTGFELWSFTFPQNRVGRSPVTYEVGGEQYIAVAVGNGFSTTIPGPTPQPKLLPSTNRVFAFKLGGTAPMPANVEYTPQALRDPPKQFASAEQIQKGFQMYHRVCFLCHGFEAAGNSVHPDLRFSPFIADKDAFNSVVVGGLLAEAGMRSFKELVDDDTAEAVRGYIISRAIDRKEKALATAKPADKPQPVAAKPKAGFHDFQQD